MPSSVDGIPLGSQRTLDPLQQLAVSTVAVVLCSGRKHISSLPCSMLLLGTQIIVPFLPLPAASGSIFRYKFWH